MPHSAPYTMVTYIDQDEQQEHGDEIVDLRRIARWPLVGHPKQQQCDMSAHRSSYNLGAWKLYKHLD